VTGTADVNKVIQWLYFAILPIVFFVPPIPIGTRKLFLFDLICILLVGILAVRNWRFLLKQPQKILVLALIGTTLLAWWHGSYRPVELANFELNTVVTLTERPIFQPLRELVIGFRFVVWAMLAGLTIHFLESLSEGSLKTFRTRLLKIAIGCFSLALLVALLGKVIPGFRTALGYFYQYNTVVIEWRYRSFGVFPSPVEAGAVYGLLGISFFFASSLSFPIRCILTGAAAVGIFLTGSLTPFLAFSTTLGLLVASRLQKTKGFLPVLVLVASLLSAAAFFVISHEGIVKFANFLHRLKVWQSYYGILTSSPQFALLGVGFWPVHADNSVIWFWSRYGLFGIGLFCWFFGKRYFSMIRSPSRGVRYLAVFGTIAALTTDFWVFRPVIAICIALCLPLFARRS